MTNEEIIQRIKPETDLERAIVSDPEFLEGAKFGKPRKGHPEGEVINHIVDVLANVDKYSNDENRADLRIIALIHDTFKYKVDEKMPKHGENHHAMIARRFAEKFNLPETILDIIELHDEAYNAWCKGDRDGKWDKADKRAYELIERLDDEALDLYTVFYKCDNETGDKSQENLEWFMNLLK